MPRPRKLTEAKELAVVRRYALGKQNRPAQICADFKISSETMFRIVRRRTEDKQENA